MIAGELRHLGRRDHHRRGPDQWHGIGLYELPILVGASAALAFGVVVGLVNGYLVIKTGVPSFDVTRHPLCRLRHSSWGDGRADRYHLDRDQGTRNRQDHLRHVCRRLPGLDPVVVSNHRRLRVLHAPVALRQLDLLRDGGDKDSARNAGIPTNRMTIPLFVFSSVCASFVGMSQAILFQSATPQLTLIFNTIIAVVGGRRPSDRRLRLGPGIFFGTITFAVVTQGIYYTEFDQTWSNLVIGVLLLGAVLMNNTFRKMALSAVTRKKAVRA